MTSCHAFLVRNNRCSKALRMCSVEAKRKTATRKDVKLNALQIGHLRFLKSNFDPQNSKPQVFFMKYLTSNLLKNGICAIKLHTSNNGINFKSISLFLTVQWSRKGKADEATPWKAFLNIYLLYVKANYILVSWVETIQDKYVSERKFWIRKLDLIWLELSSCQAWKWMLWPNFASQMIHKTFVTRHLYNISLCDLIWPDLDIDLCLV